MLRPPLTHRPPRPRPLPPPPLRRGCGQSLIICPGWPQFQQTVRSGGCERTDEMSSSPAGSSARRSASRARCRAPRGDSPLADEGVGNGGGDVVGCAGRSGGVIKSSGLTSGSASTEPRMRGPPEELLDEGAEVGLLVVAGAADCAGGYAPAPYVPAAISCPILARSAAAALRSATCWTPI